MNKIDKALSKAMDSEILRKAFLKINFFDRKLFFLENHSCCGKKILVVGAGLGLEAENFAELGCRVVALELDKSLALLPKKHFGIDSVNASAESLPFKGKSFDFVFLSCVLHHIPVEAQKKCLAEFERVLKANGELVLVEPKPKSAFDSFIDKKLLNYGFYGFFDFKGKGFDVSEHGLKQVLFAKKSQIQKIVQCRQNP